MKRLMKFSYEISTMLNYQMSYDHKLNEVHSNVRLILCER